MCSQEADQKRITFCQVSSGWRILVSGFNSPPPPPFFGEFLPTTVPAEHPQCEVKAHRFLESTAYDLWVLQRLLLHSTGREGRTWGCGRPEPTRLCRSCGNNSSFVLPHFSIHLGGSEHIKVSCTLSWKYLLQILIFFPPWELNIRFFVALGHRKVFAWENFLLFQSVL